MGCAKRLEAGGTERRKNEKRDSETHFFNGGSDADAVVQRTCGHEGAA